MTKKRNPLLTKSEALIETWRKRDNYKGYDKSRGSSYNSWRAIRWTLKGKQAGSPESWKDFNVFLKEVQGEWGMGKIVCRIDTKKPHSKENSFWGEKGTENCGKLIQLEYNGETKTLLEWANQLNQNYSGIRQRYFKAKNCTTEEILFGKRYTAKRAMTDMAKLSEQKKKDKISKMLSSYRCGDKTRGRLFNLTRDYFEQNIISKPCTYCGATENVGCDRIDNTLGHTDNNVLPACYICNTVRNNHFSVDEMKQLGKVIQEIREERNHLQQAA